MTESAFQILYFLVTNFIFPFQTFVGHMRFVIFFKILLKTIILRKNVSNLERRVGLS